MRLTLHIWRQRCAAEPGRFETHQVPEASPHMSFLELLDVLNQRLVLEGREPVAFEHDCREGICGSCGLVIDGRPHGPRPGTTVCQLHLRHFRDGQEVWVEPWRAGAFPVIKDLVVDRSAFDRILYAGGYITARTGSAPEANAAPVAKGVADQAMDFAECIGCGACVAGCPNAAAHLFVGAKIAHLGLLPQGQPERAGRAMALVAAMEREGFGACGNHAVCETVCPKEIGISAVARLNRDFLAARLLGRTGASGKRQVNTA